MSLSHHVKSLILQTPPVFVFDQVPVGRFAYCLILSPACHGALFTILGPGGSWQKGCVNLKRYSQNCFFVAENGTRLPLQAQGGTTRVSRPVSCRIIIRCWIPSRFNTSGGHGLCFGCCVVVPVCRHDPSPCCIIEGQFPQLVHDAYLRPYLCLAI